MDFGALVAFIGAYFITRDLIKATWVLVIASAIALAVGYVVERRFAPLPLITGLFALVFGVLTIFFDDDLFIKLKLTIQNVILGGILLGSLPLKKYPFKYLLGDAIKVTDHGWRILTFRYGAYFLVVAAANEVFRSEAAVLAIWDAFGWATPDPRRGLDQLPGHSVDRRLDFRPVADSGDPEAHDQGRAAGPGQPRYRPVGCASLHGAVAKPKHGAANPAMNRALHGLSVSGVPAWSRMERRRAPGLWTHRPAT
ncbi:inner membrane-spanning protein YciB [Brevundimonas denitrificans]|uniref:inner membrane-spanning protein YciB n=1 Tax=Brevundimonas denitrificans TaxID=1443434 RepID=UPI00223B8853|nr:septation protein IspZ [Brevundimonas denitrificans]